jgi:hypothetical protein
MSALLADDRFAVLCELDDCRDVMSRSRDTETLSCTVEIVDFEALRCHVCFRCVGNPRKAL